jgi:flagellar hook-associated protein 1
MTISSAFNNALSGLSAAGRATGIVSDNIANALTPGYARRSLEVATNGYTGNGVRVVGVTRHADPVLLSNRRDADATHGYTNTIAGFHAALEKAVGTTDDPTSITSRIADFESALLQAASMPESATRLGLAVTGAKDLASSISNASEELRQTRSAADRSIDSQVDRLNATLKSVEDLNKKIQDVSGSGGNVNALLDQRQQAVDEINKIVPVNIAQRSNGQIALFTDGGAVLVDGKAATLSFNLTGETKPHMTVQNNLLSDLEINGIAVRTSGPTSAIRGGTLAAQFEVRDVLSVQAQEDLDAVARDLIERFAAPGLDSTVGAGQPGLFTDDGDPFSATAPAGLAGRIEVNSVVDPDRGGDTWKLRTGLGATTPGEQGDARQLKAFEAAMPSTLAQPDNRFGTGDMTAAGISAALLSKVASDNSTSSRALSFASANKAEMTRVEQENGVDTDAEVQNLILVEQAYAANARVIQVVDELMDTLLRL